MNNFTNLTDFLNFVENQKRFEEKKDLSKMQALCKVFDHPEDGFKSIHVTGTNGKGSVVSYLSSIYQAYGLKVATFTSPYITRFNERIAINNEPISDEDILKYGNYILSKYPVLDLMNIAYPSFFEFITLIAFLYFKDQKVDLGIIEVGIGGRLDSTNVIDSIASVVTNVSYDHMNVLGDTLEEILDNKLGILTKNTKLIVGLKDFKLIDYAANYAKKMESKIYTPLLGAFEIKKSDIFSAQFLSKDFGLVEIQLPGIHQIENCLVALTTFKETKKEIFGELAIKDEIAIAAVKETTWPGRLEVMSKEPLIIIDGGHNIDGVTRVCEFVGQQNYSKKRCIFACSDNKEKEKMIKQISKHFDQIIITSFTYKRHSSASELFEYLEHPNKILMEDIDEIIKFVKEEPYDLNLFLGSLYFVSEIRPKLKA